MRIGIDIGGTKIEAAALARDGTIRLRRRIATPQGDYAGILASVKALIEEVEAELGPAASVGVAHPGTVSPRTGLVKNANSTCLIGRPLDRDLAAALGRPVRLANDANCFALSEATDGAAQGAEAAFGVILGTGVGGGIVVAGRLLIGVNAIAGEWGHSPLPWPRDDERPGPLCYCGQHGCIETFLSGPGLARDHRAITGEDAEPRRIAMRAAQGDPAAGRTLERYARPAGAELGHGHQPARPRDHRAGRRARANRRDLSRSAAALGRLRILRFGRHETRAAALGRCQRRARRRLAVAARAGVLTAQQLGLASGSISSSLARST